MVTSYSANSATLAVRVPPDPTRYLAETSVDESRRKRQLSKLNGKQVRVPSDWQWEREVR